MRTRPCFLYAIANWGMILFCLLAASCISTQKNDLPRHAGMYKGSEPLTPGLAAYYRYSRYRHVGQMPSDQSMIDEGEAGPPVLYINHRFKKMVFDSKSDTGVGVLLQGYIHLAEPGIYQFQAMSNDGVRVYINGGLVLEDPDVHSDRLSDIGEVSVSEPGWYALTVKYFQRKGTARLELHWQPPGTAEFTAVPAEAYGHVKKSKSSQ